MDSRLINHHRVTRPDKLWQLGNSALLSLRYARGPERMHSWLATQELAVTVSFRRGLAWMLSR
jgi:hypothetical protein